MARPRFTRPLLSLHFLSYCARVPPLRRAARLARNNGAIRSDLRGPPVTSAPRHRAALLCCTFADLKSAHAEGKEKEEKIKCGLDLAEGRGTGRPLSPPLPSLPPNHPRSLSKRSRPAVLLWEREPPAARKIYRRRRV